MIDYTGGWLAVALEFSAWLSEAQENPENLFGSFYCRKINPDLVGAVRSKGRNFVRRPLSNSIFWLENIAVGASRRNQGSTGEIDKRSKLVDDGGGVKIYRDRTSSVRDCLSFLFDAHSMNGGIIFSCNRDIKFKVDDSAGFHIPRIRPDLPMPDKDTSQEVLELWIDLLALARWETHT